MILAWASPFNRFNSSFTDFPLIELGLPLGLPETAFFLKENAWGSPLAQYRL